MTKSVAQFAHILFISHPTVRSIVSYEKHFDEGSMQRSLYIKITLFRWMNTAIITRLITPFVATLGTDKIDVSLV